MSRGAWTTGFLCGLAAHATLAFAAALLIETQIRKGTH